MIPLAKFLDPMILLAILLLGIFRYIGVCISNNTIEANLVNYALNSECALGMVGILAVILGVVRSTVMPLLQREYLAASVFYVTFWFVLCLPIFCVWCGMGNNLLASEPYCSLLLALFILMNILIVISIIVAKSLPARNKLT